ncbi:MAG TPA: hypothetical protein DCK78_07570 [Paenibacillus lactis]|uniref:Uncharacterized protein n=2 Tax=Paenibacillus lactis TaxID=228574 RepID=G4HDE4_9BACL|nr:hypothetical protein PaelaDRAFT_1997 [Paenibacillus lactis 154]GIO93481.1 hypothetical protein J31TS3_47080 [Paenibacillus lactis]HAF98174.1 hypothetical protein [Paenibacillus lactis]
MKKFLLCVLTLVGIVGFSTSAFAADAEDSRDVEVTTPASVEEAEKIYEEVYAETPFIKNASPGKGSTSEDSGISIQADAPLPYYFSGTFDSTLSSARTMKNGNSSTVRITVNFEWVTRDMPRITPYEDRWYDITLYENGVSKGTYRFWPDTGWNHADWTGITPGATLSFKMTKLGAIQQEETETLLAVEQY